MSTMTHTPLDLNTQLTRAQEQARQLREVLAIAESDLGVALEAVDYAAADEAKRRADEIRPHLLLAEANVTACTAAMDALAKHQREEQATVLEKDRQERAQAQHAAVMAVEREAVEDSLRLFAEAKAAMGAARNAIKAALAAESAANQARQDAQAISVDAGWSEPMVFGVAGPNFVRAHTEESRLLIELLRADL